MKDFYTHYDSNGESYIPVNMSHCRFFYYQDHPKEEFPYKIIFDFGGTNITWKFSEKKERDDVLKVLTVKCKSI